MASGSPHRADATSYRGHGPGVGMSGLQCWPLGRERMDTLNELDAARRRHPGSFAAGSDDESAALKRFADFFGDFEPGRVARVLDATYAPDVYFNDSLKAIHGSTELSHYLDESA